MTEEWRPFRDGTYEASSLGNIRRAKPGIATFVGRPVRPSDSPTGYQQVSLCRVRLYVHRVVAESFVGPCPSGHVVNHIDGDKSNNAICNLEYVTSRENVAHALRVIGRRKGPKMPRLPMKGLQKGDEHWSRRMPERVARGERMSGSKITEDVVRHIRSRCADGAQQKDLAAEVGLSVAQVSRIVRGTRWAHVSTGGDR